LSYIGDFNLGDTFDTKFTTRQISGAPSTLASSPVISAYVGNSTTEITAGITLSVDFDSRTGLNNVRVVATSGNGYATASNYQLVITTGTVNSVSVVGEVIAEFSIENRSAGLKPTVAGRTLDVSATGEAGVDWANVGSPTTALALTGTTIAVTQKVDVDTIKTNPVVNGGTATFPTNATLASTTNITAGTITTATTATNLTNAPTNGDFTAAMKTSLNAATPASVTGAVGSVTGAVGSVTGNVGGNVTGSVGSVTGLTASNLDATISSRATPAQILTTALTESYAANGAAPTLAQIQFAIHQMLMQFAISGTSLTVKKLDNATTAFVVTLDDATNPTSAVRT
jgi:hypothetical protein